MTMKDMAKELENLRRRYALTLTELMDRAEKARTAVAEERPISSHDAFNMGATTSELATLAGKIEQTANVIRWMQEAK